ncbi:hypothetical protein ACLK1T_07575 [Escherichia coli]
MKNMLYEAAWKASERHHHLWRCRAMCKYFCADAATGGGGIAQCRCWAVSGCGQPPHQPLLA